MLTLAMMPAMRRAGCPCAMPKVVGVCPWPGPRSPSASAPHAPHALCHAEGPSAHPLLGTCQLTLCWGPDSSPSAQGL